MALHYAADYSVFMALVDLIPVVLFAAAGILLVKDLYEKISAGFYVCLSSGTVMIGLSGLLKSVWKILAALDITDYVQLNTSFFVFQSFGFVLFAIGLLPLLKKPEAGGEGTRTKIYARGVLISVLIAYFSRFTHFLTQSEQLTALPKYTGNMPFIALQTLGCGAAQIILCIACMKRRKTFGAVFAIGSFVTMLFMGFLAAMDGKMDVTLWN